MTQRGPEKRKTAHPSWAPGAMPWGRWRRVDRYRSNFAWLAGRGRSPVGARGRTNQSITYLLGTVERSASPWRLGRGCRRGIPPRKKPGIGFGIWRSEPLSGRPHGKWDYLHTVYGGEKNWNRHRAFGGKQSQVGESANVQCTNCVFPRLPPGCYEFIRDSPSGDIGG